MGKMGTGRKSNEDCLLRKHREASAVRRRKGGWGSKEGYVKMGYG